MGNMQLKQHLETSRKTGVLKISLQRLQDFPPQLKVFPNVLKTLDISENRFATIPVEISRFTLLKHLNVSGNRLIELPSALGELVKLEVILVQNNFIKRLPSELANLKNLKQVNLSNNQLGEFPCVFGGLKFLDVLDVSRNEITEIPSPVKDLHVTELNVNENQISSISEDIADCPKLKTLRIQENCLPATAITPRILKESKISNFLIDGNLFNSRQFSDLDGYDIYMERYTAVRKKMF